MGGQNINFSLFFFQRHGGLNILPQKKWNVYNWDNRIQVEKDKRLAREEQERNEELRQRSGAQARIDLIKYKNKGILDQTKQKKERQISRSSSSEKKVTSKINVQDQELKESLEDKHINFFKEEEDQINREETNKALMQKETEYFKDKPFDSTSRFLGTYANEENKPWYLKSKQKSQSEKEKQLQLKSQITNFKQQEQKSFYKVLEIQKQEKEKKAYENVLEEEAKKKKEKKNEKKEKKRQEKIHKLARKLKKLIGESSDEECQQSIRVKLEEERKHRERQERERQEKLLKKVYEFDFQKKEEV